MSTPLKAAAPPIADLEQIRFDRALAELHACDPAARVSLDTRTALANGVDTNVPMSMPAAAHALPHADRSAAASVLFLDQFGALFGISGWHVLEPRNASPLGSTYWFTFAASSDDSERMISVCADGDVVRHVRVEAA